MIKLYTAVGTCAVKEVQGKKRTVLQTGRTIYFPRAAEVALWREALWNILTYQELEARFHEAMEQAHLSEGISFDWYLNHLLELGVLSCGEDETALDAMYDLLKGLYLNVPRAAPFLMKLFTFLQMVFQGCPIRLAAQVFRRPKYAGINGKILHTAAKNFMTTAELVRWFQDGQEGETSPSGYSGEEMAQDVQQVGRFAPNRHEVVKAVAQLYLDHEIMLENMGAAE